MDQCGSNVFPQSVFWCQKYEKLYTSEDPSSTIYMWGIMGFISRTCYPGPSCSKLTMSLVKDSLKFQMENITNGFLHFSKKNNSVFAFEVNI